MEPNPYRFAIRLREAPFAVGDVVRYVGTTPTVCADYHNDRQRGIVHWCRRERAMICPSRDRWWCGVDWNPGIRGKYDRGSVKAARYLAKNLELVEPRVPVGWSIPAGLAMRAAEV
jgi:hypothetical protein